MSSLAKQLNQKRNKNFGVETNGFTYVKLSDLYNDEPDEVHPVLGAYQRQGQFGLSSVIIIEGKFVNLPKHLNDDVSAILQHIDVIDDKKLGFKVVPYKSKYGQFYSVEWIDM